MRSRIFILILLLIGLVTIGYAQLINENFDGATFPPTGWVTDGYGVFTQSNVNSHSAPNSARCVMNSGDTDDYTNLQTTLLTSPGVLTYWAIRTGSNNPNTLHYQYATQAAPTTWVDISGTQAISTSWTQYTKDLSAYSNVYVRIRWNHSSVLYVDDFAISNRLPTLQASNVNFTAVQINSITVNWTRGNGANCVVFLRQGDAGTPTDPVDGTTYTASSNWSSKGTQLGTSGYYCVYNGTLATRTLTNLLSGTNYYAIVYEYNGTGATSFYLTGGATGNTTTLFEAPAVQASDINFTGIGANQVTVNWTRGTGANIVVFARQGDAGTPGNPADGTTYTASNDWNSQGSQLDGTGYYCIYNGPANSVTLTNLLAGTNYYIAAYEYNGTGTGTVYAGTAATGSTTTLYSTPTVQASSLNFTNVQAAQFTANWTRGNGSNIVVFAREGSIGTPGNPVDGTTYTASTNWSSKGTELGTSGYYCIYNGSATSETLTSLLSGTDYYAIAFEYNGAGAGTIYMSGGATANTTTLFTAPTSQASALNFTGIQAFQATANWTRGNGSNCVVFVREGTIGTPGNPVDGTAYAANANWSSKGTQLGTSGYYCIYNGVGIAQTLTNMLPGTNYYAIVYEYNGTGSGSVYMVGGATGNTTTLFSSPTVQASNVNFTGIQATQFTTNWTRGNGSNVVVFIREGTIGTPGNPVDGTTYTASTNWGAKGSELDATGYYCIYNGTGTNVALTGLLPATNYYAMIYEYNGSGAGSVYMTGGAPGITTTLYTVPITQASGVNFTSVQATQATVNWVRGNGTNCVVFVKEGTVGTPGNPANGTLYTANANWSAKGTQLGSTGYYCVYNGLSTSVTLTNLLANTNYNAIVYEYNGSGVTSVYMPNGATANTTTLYAVPTVQASNVTFTGIQSTQVTTNWVRGNGSNVVVFLREGSIGTPGNPANGTVYTSSNNWSSKGTEMGATGYYCVYNGSSTSVTITNLLPNTGYYAIVYEYNGTGTGTVYMPGGAPGTVTTLYAAPTTQATALNFTGIQTNQVTANWTRGNGTNVVVFVRASGAGTPVTPSNGVTYTASTNWSSKGTELGASGYYCIYNGTGTTATITNLLSGTAYYAVAYEYNGSGASSVYMAGGASANTSTLFPAPTTQATNVNFTAILSTSMTANWTRGNGSSCIVFVREGTAGTPGNPVDGTAYTASTNWSSKGTQLGATGYYCVFNGSGTSAALTNLLSLTNYYAIVYEYNGTGATSSYMTGGATGNASTLAVAPITQTSAVTFTGVQANQFTINWTRGNGTSVAVYVRASTAGTPGNPVNGTLYTASNDWNNKGTQLASTGYYCVYNGTGTNVTLTGLLANTAYHVVAFEYNGVGVTSAYMANGAIGNQTTLSAAPVTQVTNVNFTGVLSSQLTVNWTRGSGAGCVVFLKASPIGTPGDPANGTSFTASTNWNSKGTQLGTTGYYCIYNGTGTSAAITGLLPATTYYAIAYEYNGSGATSVYKTGGATGNATTLAPIVTSIKYYINNQEIKTLLKNTTDVKIVATVTGLNIADNNTMSISTPTIPTIPAGFLPASQFNYGSPNYDSAAGTFTWNNVSFVDLDWTPVVADDNFYVKGVFTFTVNVNALPTTTKVHDMVVLKDPTALIQGTILSTRTPYVDSDPDGWFTPEHQLRTNYTFVSTINSTNPPITADFDEFLDEIGYNPRAPLAVGTGGSTKTPYVITLSQGGTVTIYKYFAKWANIQPDAQSLWNAYEDGDEVPLYFAYQQMVAAEVLPIPAYQTVNDTRYIKVDMKVPYYFVVDNESARADAEVRIALGTTTPASGAYQLINNAFADTIRLAMNVDGTWPTGQKIYMKYYANDGNTGVGVIDIATPASIAATSTVSGWTVAEISQTPVGTTGRMEKIISLTPLTPTKINKTNIALILGQVQDKVGHVNYGLPINSTDPDYTLTKPVLRFSFSANYLIDLDQENTRAYRYVNSDRLDARTSPYVQKDSYFGFKMKLAPLASRGVDVDNITVDGIDLNTFYVTQGALADTAGYATHWLALEEGANEIYYLNADRRVSNSYAHGDYVKLQYRVNYTIHYTDGSFVHASKTSPYIINLAYVDATAPGLTSVEIWSESLGYTQEGYVVPFDSNGKLQFKFTETQPYTYPDTKPAIEVTNLDKFVSGRTVNGVVVPVANTYIVPNADVNYLSVSNTWFVDIDSLIIKIPDPAPVVIPNSILIGYTITDPVGNATSGDRMVEITARGPIVPIIRYAKIVTPTYANVTPTTVDNYIANGVTSELDVYIDTEYAAYIEDITVTTNPSVSGGPGWIGTKGTPIDVSALNPSITHGGKWLVKFVINPTTIPALTNNVNFLVTTYRNPFGSTSVFTDTLNLLVTVDGNNFAVGTGMKAPAITTMSGTINGKINPLIDSKLTATFYNIREIIGDDGEVDINAINLDSLKTWFTLNNKGTTPAFMQNLLTPDNLVIEADTLIATWNFNAADSLINYLTTDKQLFVDIKYRNVYGLQKSYAFSFYLDRVAPVVAANGIKFYSTGTTNLSPTFNYSNPPAYIPVPANWDWKKIRFEFSDPNIITTPPPIVKGTGTGYALVTIDKEAETYDTPALHHLVCSPIAWGTNYVELSFDDPQYSGFDLAEGYYNFTITVRDSVQNGAQYTQRMLYWHAPTQMTILPPSNFGPGPSYPLLPTTTVPTVTVVKNINTENETTNTQVTAYPSDAAGQVQGVHFFLYKDVNDNKTYQAAIDTDVTNTDLVGSIADGNPDMQAPYTLMWDMSGPNYKYLIDTNLPNPRNPIRKFLLRASAISEARAVSDSIVIINVQDNQAPAPNNPTLATRQVVTYSYADTTLNHITLQTNFDSEWIDAETATFIIRKNGVIVKTLVDSVQAGHAEVVWYYSSADPTGDFYVTVKGKDFVGNFSDEIPMVDQNDEPMPITINNPASNVTYDLAMINVRGFNDEVEIPSFENFGDLKFGGTVNPVSNIKDLRLDADFYNIYQGLDLEGIQYITFKAKKIDNSKLPTDPGYETILDVPNITTAAIAATSGNTHYQPDYPASGRIAVTPQIMNETVSIFVPDTFFMPTGYSTNDFTYKFYIFMEPLNPALLQPVVYSNLRVDYLAPRVAITPDNFTPNITWSQENFFKVTGDVKVEWLNNIVMEWSTNGTSWNGAVSNPFVREITNNNPATPELDYIQFNNWDAKVWTLMANGNRNYDYELNVQVRFKAIDELGNEPVLPIVVTPFVDNKAPDTPVTHVAYRPGLVNGQLPQNAIDYNTLHSFGSFSNEETVVDGIKTINKIMTSSQDYGTSTLRIAVQADAITDLSTQKLFTADTWNTFAAWYPTRTNDFTPPVRLYHGYSDTGELDDIDWDNSFNNSAQLYDHEPEMINNTPMYVFEIPNSVLGNRPTGTHFFILGSSDARGNVEGDSLTGTVYGINNPYNVFHFLDDGEKVAAIDLAVKVENVADVIMEIVSHNERQIIGEWVNLAADITENIGGATVNQARFERKVGATWDNPVVIETVTRADSSLVKFHLYRKDIHRYDGLPYVPGVHLYVNGQFKTELNWNNVEQAWSASVYFAAGQTYNFQYRLDLNDDGIISPADDIVLGPGMVNLEDPNGFTSFNVTPWVCTFNSELIPDGLYEFRAVPIPSGTVLFNQVAPSRLVFIDNTPPEITITLTGGLTHILPNVEYTTVANVNGLYVTYDDIITVAYQYSSQPANAPIRRWTYYGLSIQMAGNYNVRNTFPAPISDLIDNDNDGLVDEADEADATYYLRGIARDRAGNYIASTPEYAVRVDGSHTIMSIDQIMGMEVNTAPNQNMYSIPADGIVTLTANDITPAPFDAPTQAAFQFRFKFLLGGTWSPWSTIGNWVDVTNGTATQVMNFADFMEGYYTFRAISRDMLENENDELAPLTYAIFDDVNGTTARITSVGNRTNPNHSIPIISSLADEYYYGFAKTLDDYAGRINVTIDNRLQVNTVTFEYATNEAGPWTNINTISTNQQQYVSTYWMPPAQARLPYLYLRVVAQDNHGNDASTQIVKLYIDTVSPNATASVTQNSEPLATPIVEKVINPALDLRVDLAYLNLPEIDGVNDVAGAIVKIVNNDPNDGSSLTINEEYNFVNEVPQFFIFESDDVQGLSDGTYRLELWLTDFAGNIIVDEFDNPIAILPVDYQNMYIDRTAPVDLSMVSTSHPNNVAVLNSSTVIDFSVEYTDLYGVHPTVGGLSATFTHVTNNGTTVSDVVNAYTLSTVEDVTYVNFSWNPSAAFEQLFTNGAVDVIVSAEVNVSDALNHVATVPNTTNFFRLTYGVPNVTRIMAVRDYYYNNQFGTFNPQLHYVNWATSTGVVSEELGTNHTPLGVVKPLELYAYVPHFAEMPDTVKFAYKGINDVSWQPLGVGIPNVANVFIDPSFFNNYMRQYLYNWDISNLATGTYQVRTISTYPAGASESSIISVNIYNGTIVPMVTITGTQDGNVQRGETYAINTPAFNGTTAYVSNVVYKYRYVSVDGLPTSAWMHFGNQSGQEMDDWLASPYTYDWTVYPYYLLNETVQIVGFAQNKWGTETPIDAIFSNPNQAYALAHIVDTTAPETVLEYKWTNVNSVVQTNPAWVSGTINSNATVKAYINNSILSDFAQAAFYFDDVLLGTVTTLNNGQTEFVPFSLSNDPSIVSGVLKVMVYDVYGNVTTTLQTINIDNTQPTANFTITKDGQPITLLERETNILLNANAEDLNSSGLKQVVYAYRMRDANNWNTLYTANTANNDPLTYEWTVPGNLEFGAQYEFQTVITDNVGNVKIVTAGPYEVIDQDTEISIITVAGHNPVNHIIPFRLHGDLPVVVNVPDNGNQSIPSIEFLIRPISSENWRAMPMPTPNTFTVTGELTTCTINLNDLESGDYYLGVAPHRRWDAPPVDFVRITVDNFLHLTGITSVPTNSGYFNGSEFVVNFSVATAPDGTLDEINESNDQVHLQYAYPIDPDTWYTLDVTPEILTLGITPSSHTYQATFNDISIYHAQSIMDGYYNFRIRVVDTAIPTPNAAQETVALNVLYDTGGPNVLFSSINGETDMDNPINIELGTNVSVNATAFDILGGQIHHFASGMQKVEFWYQMGENARILIAEDTTEPYSANWSTLGYQLGEYKLIAVAYDNTGNTGKDSVMVNIVAPGSLLPYAVVSAMNFDPTTANEDNIYAVIKNWAGTNVTGVTFEYFNGNTWTHFAQAGLFDAVNHIWKATFNAEVMSNIQKIRTVTTYGNDQISTIKPELVVPLNQLDSNSFSANQTIIQSEIYYLDKFNVTEWSGAVHPYITTIFEGNYEATQMVQNLSVPGQYIADFRNIIEAKGHGKYTFWASNLDGMGNVQLVKTDLQTINVGTAVSTYSNGTISAPVPTLTGSYVYFEDVENTIPLETGYRALSMQKAAIVFNPQTGGGARNVQHIPTNITMTLNTVMNPIGDIVCMYYNGVEWVEVVRFDPEDVVNNTVTFNAPSGWIYTVAQFTDLPIVATFVSTTPQYNDAAGNVWTQSTTSIKFFVYDGIHQGSIPAFGEFNYEMYVDTLLVLNNVAANYNNANGIITYNVSNLAAGAHHVKVLVSKNGFTYEINKTIWVDVTAPSIVLVAPPEQITSAVASRTFSATITDLETGINNASLRISSFNGNSGNSLVVTFPVPENTFSSTFAYTLTMDELYNLGYTCNSLHTMSTVWEANNNLDMSAVPCSMLYTVNIDGPSIVFTGFENGWWLNPTHNTPLTFDVIATNGRTIPADGVEIALYEVTPLSSNGDDIQYMTLAPVSVNGNVYSYSLNFGQLLSPEATAVRLEVEAEDNYNAHNYSEQTYGFDYAPPVLYAMSPVGNPIDNDGDGLFNEDQINGINEDQDWDDYDHDGVWDGYESYYYHNGDYFEPPIIDEDPIDFAPAVLQYGTHVAISVAYQDIPGYIFFPDRDDWYYTGASGINASSVSVTLNGDPITGITNNGVFTYAAGMLLAGHYTVTASVADNTGNTGGLSYTFDVIGGAPNVTFHPITETQGWWLNSNNANTLSFSVQPLEQLADNGVVASIYGVPSNNLIQGPMTLDMIDNQFNVVMNGGVIPNGETGIRLEVVTTTFWGDIATSNQVYGIDNNAPTITFQSPQDNSEIAINSTVYVSALVSDQVLDAKSVRTRAIHTDVRNSSDRSAGSGVARVVYRVIDPNGNGMELPLEVIPPEVVTNQFQASLYGTYHINITAYDNVGNSNQASVSVKVLAPAPAITFSSDTNWWVSSNLVSNPLTFNVTTVSGVTIPSDGVVANLYSLPSETLIMGPIAVSPVEGEYTVYLNGGMIPDNQTGVKLTVTATNNFGVTSVSNQIYGIDNTPPQITLVSPQEDAVFHMNQNVQIVATFADANIMVKANQASYNVRNRNNDKANGSGIASAMLKVMAPDGSEAFPPVDNQDNPQSISQSFTMTQYGTYVGQLKVYDRVGNESIKLFNMAIQSPAPEISFMPFVASGWSYSLVNNEPFHFAVSTTYDIPVTNISATFYAMPENVIIKGPLNIAVNESGSYNVVLGTSITQQVTGIRLEITAMNNLGGVITNSQIYSIDRDLPVITFLSPVNESKIILVDQNTKINIRAIYSDVAMTKSISGIASAVLVVLNPSNEVVLTKTTGVDTTEVIASVDNLVLGTYTVRLSVWDKAGNKAVASVTCEVVNAPTPPEDLTITDAHIYPNPISVGSRAFFVVTLNSSANLSVKVYDFAGREVRDLNYYYGAKATAIQIPWDGRNAKGDKLARGPYFARVIANDGKKIVEKVVKVAITQ